MTTDADLVLLQARARRGSAAAFGELIRRWDDDLRGVVWSVVRSQTDTDDIMQIAYEKAFRSIETFRGDASMKTWLHSICYRSAIDHQRSAKRRRVVVGVDPSDRPATESTSQQVLAASRLASALSSLEPEARALLMMVAGLGYTFDEVATIVELPRGTVASKVGRARMQLRDWQARYDEGVT